VIIILDSEEEVEILFQPITEEQLKQALELRHVEEVELQQLVSKDSGKQFL
jgi:hypothetical protein